MDQIIQVINTVGFPIFCVLACGLFIFKVWSRDRDEQKDREDKFFAAQVKNTETLDKISDTISKSDDLNRSLSETNRKLVDEIKDNIHQIGSDVKDIKQKLG